MMVLFSTANVVLDFVATVIFSLSGCMIAESRPLGIAALPAVLCSHAGGLLRDSFLRITVSQAVVPAVCSAYSNWVASILGFLIYGLMKRNGNVYCLKHGWPRRLRVVIDYAGVGQFLTAGIVRARECGVYNPIALTFLGSISALGGGLVSLAIFCDNRKYVLKRNVVYYLTVLLTSSWAVALIELWPNTDILAFAASMVCAIVGASTLVLSEATKPALQVRQGRACVARKIGVWLSPGTLFHRVLNLTKGVRLWVLGSKHVGSTACFQFILAVV